ncbi:MAG: DegT/DnrJ/EryC1/StrS family aminotransferase [Armatimonadia bacterium]
MRNEFLPLSKPTIGPEEIAEVVDSLESGWITTGPKVQRFEELLADVAGAKHAVAMNSGTAALHVSLLGLDIGPGDEVITTPITFAATVNMILAVGARPVLVDVDRTSLNIIPELVAAAVTPATRAIMPVHFAGLPCDLEALGEIAKQHGLDIIEDAAHAIGTLYRGKPIGALSKATEFSFHPIKNITTGEGGALCTDDDALADRARVLRFHGIDRDAWKRYDVKGVPHYDVTALGYKYNMLDLQAALGIHQIARLPGLVARRREIAALYREQLAEVPGLALPPDSTGEDLHPWHLFVVKVVPEVIGMDRDTFMATLKTYNIGSALHFQAIHLHSYFAATLGYERGSLPEAEWASDRILSLPLFPGMSDEDAMDVVEAIKSIAGGRA